MKFSKSKRLSECVNVYMMEKEAIDSRQKHATLCNEMLVFILNESKIVLYKILYIANKEFF